MRSVPKLKDGSSLLAIIKRTGMVPKPIVGSSLERRMLYNFKHVPKPTGDISKARGLIMKFRSKKNAWERFVPTNG